MVYLSRWGGEGQIKAQFSLGVGFKYFLACSRCCRRSQSGEASVDIKLAVTCTIENSALSIIS